MASSTRVPLSLYVHWPYCSFLCKFCAFSKARVPSGGVDHAHIANALLTELKTSLAPHKNKELRSIYFGGGTPSLARPEHIAQIIEHANELVPLASDAEITLESNPTSAEVDKMAAFKAAGITRYSIGIQTLDDNVLRRMGRLHTGAEGLTAVDRAKSLFPGRVSCDMMFGFEGQTVHGWQRELETVLGHADSHLSLYQLTVEPGTPLFRDLNAQRVLLPADDAQAQMYEAAVEMCRARGFNHYEVSNYAASSRSQSIHNKGYWQGRQWVGIGPSAHSRFTDPTSGQRLRSVRIPDIRRWAQNCMERGHGTGKIETIDNVEARQEAVVFGLRMLDGLSNERFMHSSSSSSNVSGMQSLAEYLCMERVRQYVHDGYLRSTGDLEHLAPTERGLQVIDSILLDITP
ncbi:radical S-adenosyl methionine domain-containing protein 1 [Coemansia sp. RSA 1813]|nr:radical S-adenosyl methionine domain-containing protein 1 [Coemansia sp. RSA 1646]KAJ1773655.1 radical S-adenosyl methionine domain-containing protein 1 [Coemansia sp. RSA 1843]KAJ2092328.1 radical S-adenosyl methionine domain-containing protein 1 [Coemansia sp. RSA 986]KAJ2217443.1 radical S-adenosyl methionine domain-containing protein 1 [Coemansia sp. RSA 487]KAJ2572672.1 radical S-adenosyl methionine domain-containing protein 1 [Coemansia sp. RSA 1813]